VIIVSSPGIDDDSWGRRQWRWRGVLAV